MKFKKLVKAEYFGFGNKEFDVDYFDSALILNEVEKELKNLINIKNLPILISRSGDKITIIADLNK